MIKYNFHKSKHASRAHKTSFQLSKPFSNYYCHYHHLFQFEPRNFVNKINDK